MANITRFETSVVGLAAGLLAPVLLFVFFWWTAATLAITHVLPISDGVIAAAAFVGLSLGVALDLRYLRRWIPRVYSADLRLMALVYLACSLPAVAMFMGLPAGLLSLGALAGLYMGRREHHAGSDPGAAERAFRRAARFAALLTGLEALPIGLLALNEDWVINWLVSVTPLDAAQLAAGAGLALIVALCTVLMAVQVVVTRVAARIAYR